jgi:hypothetical protein
MKRIVVDPPTSDARRERVERKLFEQLAAVRVVERAEAVIPRERRSRTPLFAGIAVALAAAAVVVFVMLRREPTAVTASSETSRVVTPVGGTTQFTVPGALIEARSDTSVEVQREADGAVTLIVARGVIECDVEHRDHRPPFRVLAGDVTVEVVGTRFTVTRTPAPRVDVARGKVKITSPDGTTFVEAGGTWPVVTAVAPAPTPEPAAPIEMPEEPAPVKKKAAIPPPSAREQYRLANKLEQRDPQKAAQLYRSIATRGEGMEAVALVSLAEIELRLKSPAAALAALDELKKRFPNAANAEDAAWFRFEALEAMGKRDEARRAADDYLRQFPHGAYADRLRSH